MRQGVRRSRIRCVCWWCSWRGRIRGGAAGGSKVKWRVSFGGNDRLVSEYMESEFLARISQRHRAFLTRTAVFERMCGGS